MGNPKDSILTLTDALTLAQTEHVVYFLLTAYVEACVHGGQRSGLPAECKRLPVAGKPDVHERLRALREALDACAHDGATMRPVVAEAVGVFDAAWRQLNTLESPELRSRTA